MYRLRRVKQLEEFIRDLGHEPPPRLQEVPERVIRNTRREPLPPIPTEREEEDEDDDYIRMLVIMTRAVTIPPDSYHLFFQTLTED